MSARHAHLVYDEVCQSSLACSTNNLLIAEHIDVPCSYEHEEGMTRQGSLRLKLDTATSRADNLEFLFAQLQERPDDEAALLLAAIRLGADMDQLVERLKVEKGLAWLAGFSSGEGVQSVNGVV